MKPILVLTMFLLSIIVNSVAADVHNVDQNHDGDSSRHIHLVEHSHDAKHHGDNQSDSDHENGHDDLHAHLCCHFLPWEDAEINFASPVISRTNELRDDYLGITDTPPVPPPTA